MICLVNAQQKTALKKVASDKVKQTLVVKVKSVRIIPVGEVDVAAVEKKSEVMTRD